MTGMEALIKTVEDFYGQLKSSSDRSRFVARLRNWTEQKRGSDVQRDINLGYMFIHTGEWKDYAKRESDEDSSIAEGDCAGAGVSSDEEEAEQLDPDEVILDEEIITITYDYPLKGSFEFRHIAPNGKGFTRRELSEQIMERYRRIYREEERDDGNPGHIPGLLNRNDSHGRYGIWGHDIEDLILHTLHVRGDRYLLGIDS
jgi:hypothetical protein